MIKEMLKEGYKQFLKEPWKLVFPLSSYETVFSMEEVVLSEKVLKK